ncbi:helix-turn-helix domain-containing protein [Chloroflexota bacterium]
MQHTLIGIPYNKLTRFVSNTIIDNMEYVSVEEAAGITGYAITYIRQLLRENKIKAQKKGTMWWIDLESLKTYKTEMDALGNDKFFQWREKD